MNDSTTEVPRLTLLSLEYKVLQYIGELPHFHGVHWSAYFRNLLRDFLPEFINEQQELELEKIQFTSIPVELGITEYRKGDIIPIALQFNSEYNEQVKTALYTDCKFESNHFGHNVTVKLHKVTDRFGGLEWDLLQEKHIEKEVDHLRELESFNLIFYTPLKLKNSDILKRALNTYASWLNPSIINLENFKNNIMEVISRLFGQDLDFFNILFEITNSVWSENPYGTINGRNKNSLNGVLFNLKITGNLTYSELFRIVVGQYTGRGKRRTHGSGFYYIDETKDISLIKPLKRCNTLLSRAMEIKNIRLAIDKMMTKSSGEEIQPLEDLYRAPDSWLKEIASKVILGEFLYSNYRVCYIPKKNGDQRKLALPSIIDKVVHKCFQLSISNGVDSKAFTLLYKNNYGFRTGKSYKDAVNKVHNLIKHNFEYAVKIDIKDFFPSVNSHLLLEQISRLFPFDPILRELGKIMDGWDKNQIKGLPQGSPLSPMLSNIYLNLFDSYYQGNDNLFMLRYADDILILYNSKEQGDEIVLELEERLKTIGLSINAEKTIFVERGTVFTYLGYNIDGVSSPIKVSNNNDIDWQPALMRKFLKGSPLFITTYTQNLKADAKGLELLTQGLKQSFRWKEISQIIIIGKPSFNQDFIFNAMYNQVDLIYLSIWGDIKGVNHILSSIDDSFHNLQRIYKGDEAYKLNFVKQITKEKLNSSIFLLNKYNIKEPFLNKLIIKIDKADNIDTIRGYEGVAAKKYFSYLKELVKPFEFSGRSYHPPKDNVNALLSLGYTFLFNRFSALLRTEKINPYLGLYHKNHGNHVTLASDLMEQFRFISDYITIELIKEGKITEGDFKTKWIGDTLSPRLSGAGFRAYLYFFETTMEKKWFSNNQGGLISINQALLETIKLYKAAVRLPTDFKALSI